MRRSSVVDKLAQALEVEPEQIMRYSAVSRGKYTVILTNFQKYVNVRTARPKRQQRRTKNGKRKTEKGA